jgi:archaeal flagellin N-terminal-like domain
VTRGQSHVVGVAVLVAVTVVSLGTLTVTVADTVDAGTDHVAERQVAGQFVDAVQPRRVTGTHTGRLAVGSGRVETVREQFG